MQKNKNILIDASKCHQMQDNHHCDIGCSIGGKIFWLGGQIFLPVVKFFYQ